METVVAKIFKDLTDVGINKAMGYLPLNTIVQYGSDVQIFIDWANASNLHFELASENKSKVWSGALFIWDDKMLTEILEKYKTILMEAKIPTTPNEYVNHIIRKTVFYDNFPLAFIVIGFTFNDSRFTGKGDKNED